jgi:hypothetical protein
VGLARYAEIGLQTKALAHCGGFGSESASLRKKNVLHEFRPEMIKDQDVV